MHEVKQLHKTVTDNRQWKLKQMLEKTLADIEKGEMDGNVRAVLITFKLDETGVTAHSNRNVNCNQNQILQVLDVGKFDYSMQVFDNTEDKDED